jgi:hypothetical protein
MNKQLFKSVMERVESWPEAEQQELLEIVIEMEARRAGTFEPTPEELQAIDEAIEAVKRGEIATDAEVEAVFAKYRSL